MAGAKIKLASLSLGALIALPQAVLAAGGCEALNGVWKGSENPVGERDSVNTMYTIKASGSTVEVASGKASGSGDCTVDGDKYTLKLKFGDVTSSMTFMLLGSDVAQFYWDNSAGAGGRGSLTLQETGEKE